MYVDVKVEDICSTLFPFLCIYAHLLHLCCYYIKCLNYNLLWMVITRSYIHIMCFKISSNHYKPWTVNVCADMQLVHMVESKFLLLSFYIRASLHRHLRTCCVYSSNSASARTGDMLRPVSIPNFCRNTSGKFLPEKCGVGGWRFLKTVRKTPSNVSLSVK